MGGSVGAHAIDFYKALETAFYIAMPGAMFYLGGVLSRLGTRMDHMSNELQRMAERLEDHLGQHHAWDGGERRHLERRHPERGID